MNFLQLCQEANRLASMQGVVSSVSITSGYQYNLIKYVRDAWIDLQNLRKDWPFMRSSLTFNTVADTNEYSLATIGVTDLKRWHILQYTDSNGKKQPIRKMSYDYYITREINNDSSGKPLRYAEDPIDRHLYLSTPDDAYTITGYYFTQPVSLSGTTDTPTLPVSYHMLIAYLGALKMADHMGNNNLYMELEKDADFMLGNLMRDHNPGKRVRMIGIA